MARRGHNSLPRSIRKALQEQAPTPPPSSTFAPLPSSAEILHKKSEVVRTPEERPALPDPPPTSAAPPAASMLQRLGANVLLGGSKKDGSADFWVTLNDRFLGGLEIRLSWVAGMLSATLFAGEASVQQQLLERMPQLLETLQKKGLRVGELRVELRKQEKSALPAPKAESQ